MNLPTLLFALDFAAQRHSTQRRKDTDASPYINHCVRVVYLLAGAGVHDLEELTAGALHDVLEDTCTSPEEIRRLFGETVVGLVACVTDDKTLPWIVRKRAQISHAPFLPYAAQRIKIADKLANVDDLLNAPPVSWSTRQKIDYVRWAAEVVGQCRGIPHHHRLKMQFAVSYRQAQEIWGAGWFARPWSAQEQSVEQEVPR